MAAFERLDYDRLANGVRSELERDIDKLARLNANYIGGIGDIYALTVTELNGRGHTGRLRAEMLKQQKGGTGENRRADKSTKKVHNGPFTFLA